MTEPTGQARQLSGPNVPRAVQAVVAVAGLAGLTALLAAAVGTGPNDYTLVIRPVGLAWLAGETRLYDAGSPGFFNAPWVVWLYSLTVWFSPAVGQAILNTLSLVGVGAALAVFGRGLTLWVRLLAATPFWIFMLLLAGNLDGILLLGFCLSWWGATQRRPYALAAGLWLATLKPVNALPLLLCVALVTWRWSWTERLKAGSALLASFAVSLPMFGFDWPLRYLASYQAEPPFLFPIVTTWKLGAQSGVPVALVAVVCAAVVALTAMAIRRVGMNEVGFALATAGWMLVTPYALDIHYVLLIPAFLVVARHRRVLAPVAYVATYLPLARIWYGFSVIGLDLTYPVLLWASALAIARKKMGNEGSPVDGGNDEE